MSGEGSTGFLPRSSTNSWIPFFILIAILSALTGLYSSIIQRATPIDYERMTDVQDRMKEFQKEDREADALPG